MHYLIQEVNKIIENQRLENTCKGKIFCFQIIIVSFIYYVIICLMTKYIAFIQSFFRIVPRGIMGAASSSLD